MKAWLRQAMRCPYNVHIMDGAGQDRSQQCSRWRHLFGNHRW